MKKIILIICDGMGDLPIKELSDNTPLEAAVTPQMDRLAKEGLTGVMYVLGKGIRPNSDHAHLTLFGYASEEHPRRGPVEAAGLGIQLEHGDVAIRSNLATVDSELRVKDRRTGRIEDTHAFTKDLDGTIIDGIKFMVKSGTGHRVIIVMRGKGLSDNISNSDVHYVSETEVIEEWMNHKVNVIKPLDKTPEAKFTAHVLQKFLDKSHEVLEKNPLNEKRAKEGKLRGNYLLTRSPGYFKKLEPIQKKFGFKSAGCIAGAGLYKGLASIVGMDIIHVDGATGLPNTNIRAKLEAAVKNIKKYNFLYVHIKGTDIFGENGDSFGKKNFIERIDDAMKIIKDFDGLLVITADHSTPCSLKDHSADPVPVIIHGSKKKGDGIKKFGERFCKEGSLGILYGKDFMKKIVSFAKEK